MADFSHIHKDFAAFSRYYTDVLLPELRELEQTRLEKLALFKKWRLPAIGAGVLAAVLVMVSFRHGVAALIAGAVVGGIGFFAARHPLASLVAKTHGDLMPRIATQLGLSLTKSGFSPPALPRFQHYGLLPSYDRASFEDLLMGTRHGADFAIYEAHLEDESTDQDGDTTWTTVFHGQVFRIDYHKEFSSETVIRRDAGMFNRFSKPGKEFKQVGIASPRFEKAFEAWSTDQMEARYILDPIVLERFLELENLYHGKNVRAAFADGSLYIALETGDQMKVGSAFEALDSQDRIETILKEFATIYDLIDVMIKPTDGRMEGAFSVSDVRE
jgi:hypothetical protein